MLRAVGVASEAGVFAILVHALSGPARQFYLSRGFVESPLQPMTLLMTIETVRSSWPNLTRTAEANRDGARSRSGAGFDDQGETFALHHPHPIT